MFLWLTICRLGSTAVISVVTRCVTTLITAVWISGVALRLRDANIWSVETIKISLYAQARQLPLCQAQSSVWNLLNFPNNYLMLLHKLNEIFRANWTWISAFRASSIFNSVPVSQDSNEFMLNASSENLSTTIRNLYLEPLGIFWTNTKYSGEVSLIISADIHRELIQCVKTWIFSAHAWQSVLLLTQGNIYKRLRFINKYLVF